MIFDILDAWTFCVTIWLIEYGNSLAPEEIILRNQRLNYNIGRMGNGQKNAKLKAT